MLAGLGTDQQIQHALELYYVRIYLASGCGYDSVSGLFYRAARWTEVSVGVAIPGMFGELRRLCGGRVRLRDDNRRRTRCE